MKCLYCNQLATGEGKDKSRDGERMLTFWRCKPCQAVWVVPAGMAARLPGSTPQPVVAPTKDRKQWAMEYFKLPPRPALPCRKCGSTRFWLPTENCPVHLNWQCVICVKVEEGMMQRVTEIETRNKIESGRENVGELKN